ncbi:hypothetical protein E5288_WYG003296 [Bos mutus]|uniref:Uncharacterized protein n=1 Tax=Bos mutus TaxID=72004 RepID=A0A6B0S463_9CETA|nr:hypothetical protein [Bos mutus]
MTLSRRARCAGRPQSQGSPEPRHPWGGPRSPAQWRHRPSAVVKPRRDACANLRCLDHVRTCGNADDSTVVTGRDVLCQSGDRAVAPACHAGKGRAS